MSEFENRIKMQREVLQTVNEKIAMKEPLYSLTDKAINRWVLKNRLEDKLIVVSSIQQISEELFFLANKSQEQVTEEYKDLSIKVDKLFQNLRKALDEEGYA